MPPMMRFRQSWPEIRIIFRGGSGFYRPRMLAWCERHDMSYIVGIAQNERLNGVSAQWWQAAEKQYAASGEKVCWFDEFTMLPRTGSRHGASSLKSSLLKKAAIFVMWSPI